MTLFRKRKVFCPAGKWTTLISNFGTGMPKTFTVAFTSDSWKDISGEFIERKYTWIFPRKPVRGALLPMMKFNREWINGIYTVKVKPDIDLVAEFK